MSLTQKMRGKLVLTLLAVVFLSLLQYVENNRCPALYVTRVVVPRPRRMMRSPCMTCTVLNRRDCCLRYRRCCGNTNANTQSGSLLKLRQDGLDKPGVCPQRRPLGSLLQCPSRCLSDYDCPGSQKCCPRPRRCCLEAGDDGSCPGAVARQSTCDPCTTTDECDIGDVCCPWPQSQGCCCNPCPGAIGPPSPPRPPPGLGTTQVPIPGLNPPPETVVTIDVTIGPSDPPDEIIITVEGPPPYDPNEVIITVTGDNIITVGGGPIITIDEGPIITITDDGTGPVVTLTADGPPITITGNLPGQGGGGQVVTLQNGQVITLGGGQFLTDQFGNIVNLGAIMAATDITEMLIQPYSDSHTTSPTENLSSTVSSHDHLLTISGSFHELKETSQATPPLSKTFLESSSQTT